MDMKNRIPQSIWKHDVQPSAPLSRRLEGDARADVLIIGGGMAGILCAHKLHARGVNCAVVEQRRVGSGVSGNTTAKITAQHGLIYHPLMKKRGVETARQYYDINQRAVEEYRALARRVECDFEAKQAFVYSVSDREKLDREADAYRRLGIPGLFNENTPLPLRTCGALGMAEQAQFHPLKMLDALAKELTVYEETPVTALCGGQAVTPTGTITAQHIVLATHFPLVNIPGLYFMKLYQHRSYVIAMAGGPQIGGMYVDEREDGHSFRNHGDYLLIGGGDHRTGKRGGGWAELKTLAARAYPGKAIRFMWAAQDCMSLDGVPYIGRHRPSQPHLYVASGFNKWGMTGAMVAAMVLSDLILAGRSDAEALFSPRRSMMSAQLFTNMGSSVAGLLRPGRRCTHMGCALSWNRRERTWDCTCHGSRFDEVGGLIDNPATEGLKHE